MEEAIGVRVVWEDREFFLIPKPKADTIDKIRAFIESYRTDVYAVRKALEDMYRNPL